MVNRVNPENKSKPGIAYIMYIGVRFNLSAPGKLQKELRALYPNNDKRKDNLAYNLKKKHLEALGVKYEKELLKKHELISDKVAELNELLVELTGVPRRKFSNMGKEWMEELIKERRKK